MSRRPSSAFATPTGRESPDAPSGNQAASESGIEDLAAAHDDGKATQPGGRSLLHRNRATPRRKPLGDKQLQSFTEQRGRSGVVYMSRVPPHMKPRMVKQLLSAFGAVGRIYLAAEEEKRWKQRRQSGGSKQRQFNEGWIEFLDKRVAKAVALTLNNQPMVAKKSSRYHDDVWNLRYLPKFKWLHLTQQLTHERLARAKSLQLEISQAKKLVQFYLGQADKSKMIRAIESRNRSASLLSATQPDELTRPKECGRRVRQRRIVIRHGNDDLSADLIQDDACKIIGLAGPPGKHAEGGRLKRVLDHLITG